MAKPKTEIYAVTSLNEALKMAGVRRTDLARRLGVSRAHLAKALDNYARNAITFADVEQLLDACDMELIGFIIRKRR